jgi:signal transduction histidine kinase/ligand-binding sensor domain-containing protein
MHVWLLCGLVWNASPAGRAMAAEPELSVTADAVRILKPADGLPSGLVTTVLQTHDRFLWVGTSEGLVRFDGIKFTEVELPVAAGRKPVAITALCEDSRGGLWIGTQQDGLFELLGGQWRHFTRQQGLLEESVTCLTADKAGLVWAGSRAGLNLWNGQNFRSFTTRDGLPDDFVSSVNVARSGTVWITTRTGMCRFVDGGITPYAFEAKGQGRSSEYLGAYEDRRGNLWAFGDTYLINLAEGKRFNYFHSSESASVRIWSLCEGRDGRLWIGTSGRGLFCFEDGRFQPVILGEARWPYDVRAICEDVEGNLWLGTSGGGLLQLRPQSVHVFQAGEGLPAAAPTAIASDSRGGIFAGLLRGGLFVGEAGRFERVDAAGLSAQNFISSLCVARDGAVWASTLGDGLYGLKSGRELHFTTADGLVDDRLLAVAVDEGGTVWVSTASGALQSISGEEITNAGPLDSPVTAMVPSASGGLWLGTEDGSVLRLDKGPPRVVRATMGSQPHAVLALHEGEQSRLWVGTDGGGLGCITNGGAAFWSTNNGLPSATVAAVAEDGAKNLWLATGEGIYRLNRNDVRRALAQPESPLECQLISQARTLPEPGTVCCGARAVLSREGALWFATAEGVLKVDARQSERPPATIPLYIESVTFNSQAPRSLLRGGLWSPPVANDSVARAPLDFRSLEIRFTALGFAAPTAIRFRHKLEGADSDWVEDGAARYARYGKLPYGQYRFRVAIRAAEGDWREAQETFAFIVPTPLYFQTWAIGLYAVSAVALVAGTVRVVSHRRLRSRLARLEQQQALERERMRIARDLHDEMGSKLAKMSFLSEHAQINGEAAGPLAGKLKSIAQNSRDLLRTMDEIVWVVNPRNDTLENLVAYLSHYAGEYFQNTAIQCEMQLPQDIPHCPLSSEVRHNLFLTVQEALNNVLKHSAATSVKVEMTFTEPKFEVRVTDNGRGFEVPAPPAPGDKARGGRGGNGLKNMRQRLLDIGGECIVLSRPGQGTTVSIRLRINTAIPREP